MSRVSQPISFDEDDMPIINEILSQKRGLLSEICKKAIREWKGDFEKLTVEECKQKITECEMQQSEIEGRKQFYLKRLSELIERQQTEQIAKEIEQQKAQAKEKSKWKTKKEHEIIDFLDYRLTEKLSGKEKESLIREFLDSHYTSLQVADFLTLKGFYWKDQYKMARGKENENIA